MKSFQAISRMLATVGVAGLCVTAAQADVFTDVPEAAGYRLAYQLDIQNGVNLNGGFSYNVNNSGSIVNGTFSRVGYYLELGNGVSNQFVYASFNSAGFTGNASKI